MDKSAKIGKNLDIANLLASLVGKEPLKHTRLLSLIRVSLATKILWFSRRSQNGAGPGVARGFMRCPRARRALRPRVLRWTAWRRLDLFTLQALCPAPLCMGCDLYGTLHGGGGAVAYI